MLVDLQRAPIGLSASHHGVMQAIIADVARQERVGLFSRFALMRRSVEAGLPAGASFRRPEKSAGRPICC